MTPREKRITSVAALAIAGTVAAALSTIIYFHPKKLPEAIPDQYRMIVTGGRGDDTQIRVPWNFEIASAKTGEEARPGMALALTRPHEYNIHAGDLPGVLHQIIEPIGFAVFTNSQFSGLDERLRDALLADMKGMRAGPITGRHTVAEAIKLALDGTGCKYELLDDKAVYAFCRNHLVFEPHSEPKAEPVAQ
jgi:hypothetical protein